MDFTDYEWWDEGSESDDYSPAGGLAEAAGCLLAIILSMGLMGCGAVLIASYLCN